MALSTTILELRNRARDREEADLDRPRMVEVWRHDVGQVFGVIRAALKPYVDDGSAVISVGDVEVTEEDLGQNSYERLVIEIVGRRIIVSPVARFTVGGTGRIDMYLENRPSEDRRILIVRGAGIAGHDPALWLIETKGEAASGPAGPLPIYVRGSRRYHDLAPSAIESAVEHLLRQA